MNEDIVWDFPSIASSRFGMEPYADLYQGIYRNLGIPAAMLNSAPMYRPSDDTNTQRLMLMVRNQAERIVNSLFMQEEDDLPSEYIPSRYDDMPEVYGEGL
jgi:hypothetical protein